MKKIFTLLTVCALAFSANAQNLVDLNVIGSYSTGIFDESAMEIVAYNDVNQTLYAINGDAKTVDVFDITDPTNIIKTGSIDVSTYGDGPNSVAFYGGVIAVAVEADDFDANGKAVFFDDASNYLADVEVGVLPDMITFTNDGTKVLVANEGEPDDDYTGDPMGTVSIIDMAAGAANLSQTDVTTLDFTAFNNNYDPAIRNFGPVADFYDDFENTADSLNNFIFVMPSGDVSFYYDSYSGDHFVEVNAYSSSGYTEAYLITPPQNLIGLDSAYFSFYNAMNWSGGSLDILVSTDYDASVHTDPATANWDTITSNFAFSTGGYTDTFSGRYSMHNYMSEMVSVAFFYTGNPGSGGSTLWQIDDISFEGTQPELACNLEPEYITVAPAGDKAFVVMQENNAMAVIDLATNTITTLKSLGFKDWAMGPGFDASNETSAIDIRNWPTLGMYQPDAIKAFEVNGQTYIATANEGDARDYDFYSEEDRVKDLELDSLTFPNAANIQDEDSLGRLKITTSLGDIDGDGDYDEIYSYGARSFSIWDDQLNLVYDSGDDFEQVLATEVPTQFNSTNDDNSSFKNRSDDKGCEPEAIEVAEINGYTIAFIGLERMGGVMVYDITDPTNPSFVSYYLNRDFTVNADDPNAGDLGPEDLKFIPADKSPNGQALLVTANEVSGTLSIYGISGTIGLNDAQLENALQAYPNPSNGLVTLSQKVEDGILYSFSGKRVMEVNGSEIDLSALPNGIYTLIAGEKALQIMKK